MTHFRAFRSLCVSGIGFAIAERLGLSGAHVVICSRDQKNVDAAVSLLRARNITVTGLAIHVGTMEARAKLVAATVAAAGKIDILVSNVAVNPVFGPMLKVTDEKSSAQRTRAAHSTRWHAQRRSERRGNVLTLSFSLCVFFSLARASCFNTSWDKVFDVNVKSHFFLVRECLPYMAAGSAVLIVSSYAGYTPNPLLGAYSVSKTALISLTKVLGTELAGRGIRVNCVAPGVIKTKFSEQLWKGDSAVSQANLNDIPLGRFGEPHEVGALACFLCSNDASYITGETIVVAGGIQSRL